MTMRKKTPLSERLQVYCDESTVHGVQYVAPNRGWIERILWVILILMFFTFASLVVSQLLNNWEENPIITTIGSTSYPIQKIPFPGVTVCPNGFDVWAFSQKVLNAIKVNTKSRSFFENSIKSLWTKMASAIDARISKSSPSEVRQNIVEECKKSSSVMFNCLSILIIQKLAIHNATETYKEVIQITDDYSKKAFRSFSTGKIHETEIVPRLQDLANEWNADCEDCFPSGFQTLFVAKGMDDKLCDITNNFACSRAIQMAYTLHEKLKTMFSMTIDQLGTLNGRVVSGFSDYLIGSLTNGTVDMSYLKYVYGLAAHHELEKFVYLDELDNAGFLNMSYDYGSLETIMKVMKEVSYQPHIFDLQELYARNFTDDIDVMQNYPDFLNKKLTNLSMREPESEGKTSRLSMLSILEPVIPYCMLANKWSNPPRWGSKAIDVGTYRVFGEICTLFKPTLTDHGICHTFNADQSEDLLKPSRYIEAYKAIFGLNPDTNKMSTYKANGIGVKNGLLFIFDAHTLTSRYKKKYPNKDRTFTLTLQHPADFPLPIVEGLVLKGGFRTSIVIHAEKLSSKDSTRDIDIAKRNCYFSDEQAELLMFEKFSQKGCLFECLWKQALDDCGCIPWKYPRPNYTDAKTCNPNGNTCWQLKFEDGEALLNCSCPYDCIKTSYTYFTNQQEFKAADCESEDPAIVKVKDYIENHQRTGHMAEFWTHMADLTNETETVPSFNCPERLVKDIAIVEIYFGSPFVTKLQKDLTATFTDKLASMGGTLGLFCGISLMSFVETFLCLVKLVLWFFGRGRQN